MVKKIPYCFFSGVSFSFIPLDKAIEHFDKIIDVYLTVKRAANIQRKFM